MITVTIITITITINIIIITFTIYSTVTRMRTKMLHWTKISKEGGRTLLGEMTSMNKMKKRSKDRLCSVIKIVWCLVLLLIEGSHPALLPKVKLTRFQSFSRGEHFPPNSIDMVLSSV